MHYLLFCLILLISSCSTPQVIVKTSNPSTISLVSWSTANQTGEVLGPSPQTIETAKLTERIIKISQPGYTTQYWVFSKAYGDLVEAKISLRTEASTNNDKKDKGKGNKEDKRALSNRVGRFLLDAYAELIAGNHTEVRSITAEISKIDKDMATPHILTGLSYLEEGNRSGALSSFKKAQALDPYDPKVKELFELVR
jgi:hypothetical protein